MADSVPLPSNPSDPGIGPLIMGLTWTLTILSLFVIALRFWIRVSVTKMLGAEDWLILAAGIINLVCQAFATVSYHFGMGKHDADLSFDQAINTLKWEWLASTPGIVSSTVSRISIAILLVRIFGNNHLLKWYIIATVVLQSLGASLLIIFSYAQSIPVEGVWDPTINSRHLDANYVIHTAYTLGSIWALEDLTYVLFPVIIIWGLNMHLRRKLLLCVLLALSLITFAISIVKTIHAQGRLGSQDEALFNASVGSLLGMLEQEFVIIMGCAPSLSSAPKLQIKSISNIASSLRNLMSSSSRLTKKGESKGISEYSGNVGTYYELRAAGQTLSQVRAGLQANSSDQLPGHDVEGGQIYKTSHYTVTSGQGKEPWTLDQTNDGRV